MKTQSRATAAASTDAAAAVAKQSYPRGLAKKRHGRFLPRAISSVLASLSKLELGTPAAPVSSEKINAAPVPRAKKPSSRVKRARSRRARAKRLAPKSARQPAPGPEKAVARFFANPTRPGRENASAKTTKDASARAAVSSPRAGEKRTRRRRRRASRLPAEGHARASPLPRADSMVFSPLVRCDDDDFGEPFGTGTLSGKSAREGSDAARLPAEVFGGRDASCEDVWAESDPEGEDNAWERGDEPISTHRALDARDAILRSPVAWTPASPRRRTRGARR